MLVIYLSRDSLIQSQGMMNIDCEKYFTYSLSKGQIIGNNLRSGMRESIDRHRASRQGSKKDLQVRAAHPRCLRAMRGSVLAEASWAPS